jgi:hypothetical protein
MPESPTTAQGADPQKSPAPGVDMHEYKAFLGAETYSIDNYKTEDGNIALQITFDKQKDPNQQQTEEDTSIKVPLNSFLRDSTMINTSGTPALYYKNRNGLDIAVSNKDGLALKIVREVYDDDMQYGKIHETSIYAQDKLIKLEDTSMEKRDWSKYKFSNSRIEDERIKVDIGNPRPLNLDIRRLREGFDDIKFVNNQARVKYLRSNGKQRIIYMSLDQANILSDLVKPDNHYDIKDRIEVQKPNLTPVTIKNLVIRNGNLVTHSTQPGENPRWGIPLAIFKNPMNREIFQDVDQLKVNIYLKNGPDKGKVQLSFEEYKKIINSEI